MLQKLAVVYDPHNIAQEIFKHSTPDRLKLHYIECIQDLEPVYATITSAAAANSDNASTTSGHLERSMSSVEDPVLFLNFGGGPSLMVEMMDLLKQMDLKSLSILVVISRRIPLPTSVSTVINMDMDGAELRNLALHMFGTTDEHHRQARSGQQDVDAKTEGISGLESSLINLLMEDDLINRANTIIDKASKLDALRGSRRFSIQQHRQFRDSLLENRSPEVLFPVAVVTGLVTN